MAIVMFWDLPLAQFETALNADALYTADLIVSPPLNLPIAGGTSGHLYDFMINGTAVSSDMINQYFDASLYTPANSTFSSACRPGRTSAGSSACCRRSIWTRPRPSRTSS
jgi:hypothetical protein